MKMVILFDLLGAQPNNVGSKFHGGGEYIKTIFSKFVDLYGHKYSIIVFYNKEKFMDDWVVNILRTYKVKVYNVQQYSDIRAIFENENIDVYYSGLPYDNFDFEIPKNICKIGTLHGLRNLEKPTDIYEYKYKSGLKIIKAIIKQYRLNKLKNDSYKQYEKIISGLDIVICDSDHSLFAMKMNYYNLHKVFYKFFPPAKYVEDKHGESTTDIKGKYILILGMNRWEKNGYRAICALEELFSSRLLEEYKVVTVGKIPNQINKRISNKEKYIEFDYVAPMELEELYKGCDIFMYPSLNEGFGLPPLEAMKYGKTCIVSAVCSLTEICGDSVYYFNPYDIDEIKCRILCASEQKIDKEKIDKHMKHIKQKQESDTIELCKLIAKEI